MQSDGRADYFTEDGLQCFGGQGAVRVQGSEAGQQIPLAFGGKVAGIRGLLLGAAHVYGQGGTFTEQAHEFIVNGINLRSQGFQCAHGAEFRRGEVVFLPDAERTTGRLCPAAAGYNRPMLAARIIPCLDVLAGRVVKGVNFTGLRDAGDPVELAAFYSDAGGDEGLGGLGYSLGAMVAGIGVGRAVGC